MSFSPGNRVRICRTTSDMTQWMDLPCRVLSESEAVEHGLHEPDPGYTSLEPEADRPDASTYPPRSPFWWPTADLALIPDFPDDLHDHRALEVWLAS